MGSRSPSDVGVEVVAGLIAIASQRQRAVNALRAQVEAAVQELDPAGLRDHSATWSADHPWARPDAFDRFRRAFEDIMLLEVQANEITDGLRSMLNPTAVRRLDVPTPVIAHRRLARMAERRLEEIGRLQRALRAVRPGLTAATAAGVRCCIREMLTEETRAADYRDTLGRLLSMGDQVSRAG